MFREFYKRARLLLERPTNLLFPKEPFDLPNAVRHVLKSRSRPFRNREPNFPRLRPALLFPTDASTKTCPTPNISDPTRHAAIDSNPLSLRSYHSYFISPKGLVKTSRVASDMPSGYLF